MPEDKRKQITLRIKESTLARMRKAIAQKNVEIATAGKPPLTRSDVFREATESWLKANS